MADIITSFGNYINKTALDKPQSTRKLLLTAYRANALAVRLKGEKRLSPARRLAVNHINDVVISMMAHPNKAVLTSVFMPCELIHAAGLIPLCAELYSTYMNGTACEEVFAEAAEAEGISESYCSYHKIMLGTAFSGVMPAPKMAVNCSTVCDANNLTFKTIGEYFDIPVFYIDVPSDKSDASLSYVTEQFRELAELIEKTTGRKIDDDALSLAMQRSKNTIENLKLCAEEKRTHTQRSSVTSELNEIYMSNNAVGGAAADRYASMLADELKRSPARQGKRLLWLQTIPIWQSPVRELLNFNDDIQIIASDMNLGSLIDIDPQKPYESMAKRLLYNTFNGSGEERIKTAIEEAKFFDVDGVVCFCHWGCKQMMGLSAMFKTELEKEGFPTLVLNGDGCDRRNASDGQVATRLNAFCEMLDQ